LIRVNPRDADDLPCWGKDEEHPAAFAAAIGVDSFVGLLLTDVFERLVPAVGQPGRYRPDAIYAFVGGDR
jgi:hypothetical protein